MTLIEAGVLVLVVIVVFLQDWRATLVPATTIPVTIIGAFAAMAALGFTINLSTLFGIVLAIGIVVDDAIVIVEGVARHIERGMSAHDAAVKAMEELFGPVIGITLVLMSVFIPAAFVPGLTGKMFAQFALVIAATAFISAVNAATLKPTQCAMWLRPDVPPEQRNFFFRGFNAGYDRFERGYAWLIRRHGRRSGLMVLLALVLAGDRRLGHRPPADRLHPQRGPGLSDGRGAAARRRLARPHRQELARRRRQDRQADAGRASRWWRSPACRCSTTWRSSPMPASPSSSLDDWGVRGKNEGPGHPLDRPAACSAQTAGAAGRPRHRRSARRRSRASAMPRASRCRSSSATAASTSPSCRAPTDEVVEQARTQTSIANPCHDLPRRRAAHRDRRRPRQGGEPERRGGRRVRDAVGVRRLDLRQPLQQVRPEPAGLRPGRFAVSRAARGPAAAERAQQRRQDGADRRAGADQAGAGRGADQPLQPLSLGLGRSARRRRA